MSIFLSSPISSALLGGQPKARRRLAAGNDFGAYFEEAGHPDGAATQLDVTGIASAALLAVPAHSGEPPPHRRPSQAVIEDALAMLKHLQMSLLGHSLEGLTLHKLEELASELDEVSGNMRACRSLALRLRVEILRRKPAEHLREG